MSDLLNFNPKKNKLERIKEAGKNFWHISKKKHDGRKVHKAVQYFLYVFTLVFLFATVSFAAYPSFIPYIYGRLNAGEESLGNTLLIATEENFNKAFLLADFTKYNFSEALEKFKSLKDNFFISNIGFLGRQAGDVEKVLETTDKLSNVVKTSAAIGKEIEDTLQGEKRISLSKFTHEERRRILKIIDESEGDFEQIKSDLDIAYDNLNKVEYAAILSPFKDTIEALSVRVTTERDVFTKALPMLKVWPVLFGYPKRATYLIVIQDNNILRPTGGFINTYSIFDIEYGEIEKHIVPTHDIYYLDNSASSILNIEPPSPIKKYLGINKWFMRDSNWSPDWGVSARKLEWFYGEENRLLNKNLRGFEGELDGVIAITPKVIEELIAITGAIQIDGKEYNKDNFSRLLEYKIQGGKIQMGVPAFQNKEVMTKLFYELKVKLFDLPPSRWREFINIVHENLETKDILTYLKNQEAQELLKTQGATGEIKDYCGDFLMIVDANMNSLKTDKVMEKKVSYKLGEDAKDGLIADLELNYNHKGDYDINTSQYRTYTRVYVPQGSQLIEVAGIQKEKIEVYDEFGKTCFAFFISIPPGQAANINLTYILPKKISDFASEGNYGLYVQKQPGNNIKDLNIELNFIRDIMSLETVELECADCIKGKNLEVKSNLYKDKEIKILF